MVGYGNVDGLVVVEFAHGCFTHAMTSMESWLSVPNRARRFHPLNSTETGY